MRKGGKPDLGLSVAVALLLAIVVGVATWSATNLVATQSLTEHIENQRRILNDLDKRVSVRAVRGEVSVAPVDIGAKIYLHGATLSIAGAALQKAMAGAVEDAGGRIIETQIYPGGKDEQADAGLAAAEGNGANGPGRVDLRITLEIKNVGLQRLLFGIETGLPLLTTRRVTINSFAARGGQ